MNIEEEIAAKIREVDGNHTMGASAISSALMPLVKRAQAEAEARSLREAANELPGWTPGRDRVSAWLYSRADRIESEVSGV